VRSRLDLIAADRVCYLSWFLMGATIGIPWLTGVAIASCGHGSDGAGFSLLLSIGTVVPLLMGYSSYQLACSRAQGPVGHKPPRPVSRPILACLGLAAAVILFLAPRLGNGFWKASGDTLSWRLMLGIAYNGCGLLLASWLRAVLKFWGNMG